MSSTHPYCAHQTITIGCIVACVDSSQSVRFLPYIGYVTIAMVRSPPSGTEDSIRSLGLTHVQNDFPQLKYALLGTVGLFLLVQKEHS